MYGGDISTKNEFSGCEQQSVINDRVWISPAIICYNYEMTTIGTGTYILIGLAIGIVLFIWAGYFFRIPILPVIYIAVVAVVFLLFWFYPLEGQLSASDKDTDSLWILRFILLLVAYVGCFVTTGSLVLYIRDIVHAKKI